MSSEFLERQSNKLVRLALASERRRVPLKREDIIKFSNAQVNSKNFSAVYELTQEKLRSTFGFELAELPVKDNPKGGPKASTSKKDSSQSTKTKGSRTYVLINKLSIELKGETTPQFNTPGENKFLAITMCMLSLIFVNNHVLSHASLLHHLQKFDVAQFKEAKNFVQMLLKQGYLIRFQSDQNGNSQAGRSSQRAQGGNEAEEFANLSYNYQWGPRAKTEVTIDGLLSFMEEIFGDQAPFNLPAQLQRFEKELATDT